MNTKFTKGPWGVGRSVKTMVFADEGLDLVADCTVGEFARDVEIANAALIASAPELYAALEQIAALYIDDRSSAMHKALCIANKALKKARCEA